MANTFYALNRGVQGFKISDITIGSSSSASSDIELRLANTDGGGGVMTRLDIQTALRAFERALASGKIFTTFPPL